MKKRTITILHTGPADEDQIEALLELLSIDEQERHSKMRLFSDRRDYVLAHLLLRNELSKWHPDTPPGAWSFERLQTGKPSLSATAHLSCGDIDFSLTHTDGLVACALTDCGHIGIDAERRDRDINIDRLARDVLTIQERTSIATLETSEQREAFIRHWTLKEAGLKAVGIGLNTDLAALQCSFSNDPFSQRWVATIEGLPPPGHEAGTVTSQEARMAASHFELMASEEHIVALAHLMTPASLSHQVPLSKEVTWMQLLGFLDEIS